MNRFKKDTRALGKIGFLIFIILVVVIATVGGNAILPFTGDQKIAAGDYLEYKYTYIQGGVTDTATIRYTFTTVSLDEVTVNVDWGIDEVNITVGIVATEPLTFDWPVPAPYDDFDIFHFMHLKNDSDAVNEFAFQNVGVNIILMDSYIVNDFLVEPWWTTDRTADNITLMVKMGTNIPIYMEMSLDDGDEVMIVELVGSSIPWITLI